MKFFKAIKRFFQDLLAEEVEPERKAPLAADEDERGDLSPKHEHPPCPPYQTADGKETTATDPRRLIFYGSGNCSFWTDNWTKVALAMGQIPVCPHCGQVGFQIEAGQWDKEAADYEAHDHPGYVEFLATTKEKCFHNPILAKYGIWARAKGYTQDREVSR